MVPSSLSDGLRETLDVFDRTAPGTPLTTTEVAERLDVGRRSTYDRLERLDERGLLATKKVGARGRIWWRPPTGGPPWGAAEGAPATELERVFDRIDDAVWALDEEWRFTYINERAEEILEQSAANLVGEVLWEALPWLSDLRANEKFEEAVATGETVHFEDYVEATGRWYGVRAYPSASGLSVYYQDVTERKERERALAESERNNRALVENFPNGAVSLFDRDLRHVAVGGQLFPDFGMTAEDMEGRTPAEVLPPAAVEQIEPHFRAVFSGESREFEVEVGGDVRLFRTHPVRDDDGEIVAGLGMSQDVTDRRERERELERYETIVETVDDGVYAVDEDGTFVLVNDSFCAMVGYDREELLGRHASTVAAADVPPRAERLANEVAAGERDLATLEVRLQTKSGASLPVETRFGPYPLEDGFGRCGVVRDVTERIEREREIERYVGIVDAVGEPVYELDEQGRFSFVNDALVERSGYSESELLGEHVSIGMADEDVERVEAHMLEFLADGGGGRTTVEFDVISKEGERIPAENRIYLRTDEAGRYAGSAGMLWDVTERKERERKLKESEQRYRTLVENFPNGAVALYDEECHYIAVGGQMYDRLDLSPEDAVGMTVRERLSGEIVESLETTIERAFEGETAEVEASYDGRDFWLQSLPIRDDDGEVILAMVVTQDVTERKEAEEALERQRERLTALNELNEVVREITDAAIEQSTREEIERIVCERLADAEPYEFAWIGDVDGTTGSVDVRAAAGEGGSRADDGAGVSPGHATGPTERSLVDGEIRVARDVDVGADGEDDADDRAPSVAAIPIVHEGTRFGSLSLYADRPDAFSEDERAVVGQLGEVVGHAIAAADRKQALMSEEVVEVEFRVRDVFERLDVPAPEEGAIYFERTVPLAGEAFLVYGTATGDAIDAADAIVETGALPHWQSLNVLSSTGDAVRFEIRMDEPPLLSTAASHGGYVADARMEGGDYHMRLRLAPSADVRQVVDALVAVYPDIEMVSRQQVNRGRPGRSGPAEVSLEPLTDRQRAAVEAAYHSGYFEWPRASTGGDVADSLGIDPSTFHYHLRTAQRKVLGSVLGAEASA